MDGEKKSLLDDSFLPAPPTVSSSSLINDTSSSIMEAVVEIKSFFLLASVHQFGLGE